MDNDDGNPPSRREVFGGVTLGLTAAAAVPAFAQEQHAPGAPTSARSAIYPKPPFQKQQQP